MNSAVACRSAAGPADTAAPVAFDVFGRSLARYGLVAILLWIGGMKFTAYEAEAIRGFVAHSPLLSWTYSLLSVRGLSALVGFVEIVVALLILARPLSTHLAAVGGALAVGMFLTTLSFLATTPGAFEPTLGFPGLSVPGQFLLKDVALLGISLWVFGEAWAQVRR